MTTQLTMQTSSSFRADLEAALRAAGWTPVGDLWLSPRPLMNRRHNKRADTPWPLGLAITHELYHERSLIDAG